jgi:hypothetical protein
MIMRRQQGIVLIAMLAVIAMSAAWFTVRNLASLPGGYTALNRTQNAAVLARAKAALMGHVALQAAKAGETDPGRFVCPEAPANIGGSNEGTAASSCTFPAIGRYPWNTLATDKFLDAAGEPLWYVIASGWAYGTSGTLVINPNCTSDATLACNSGLLTVDGVKDTVALIIAPGQAMNELAATGCTARNQTRAAPAPTINALDYLECYNTATSSFVTKGGSTSFNDQVVKITVAEIMPVIQAAIADRIAHELAPLWKSAYSGGNWAATPVLPFAAPFSNPTTASYKGTAGTLQGLPPLNYAFTASPGSASACAAPCTPTACTVSAANPRCDPGFVTWQGATITQTAGASLGSYNCSVAGTPSVLTCNIYTYDGLNSNASMTFNFSPRANNAGMALRQINATVPFTGLDATYNAPYGYNTIAGASTVNNDGSATVALTARVTTGGGTILGISLPLCGILSWLFGLNCYQRTVTVPMALLSDHQLVDPGNSNPAGGFTDHSWYFRTKWNEFSYYAVAAGIAPSGARSCTTGTNCLVVNYNTNVAKQRGILALGGAKIGNQARPPVAVTDLLEGANADLDTVFTAHGAPGLLTNKTFNDHIVVIDTN